MYFSSDVVAGFECRRMKELEPPKSSTSLETVKSKEGINS